MIILSFLLFSIVVQDINGGCEVFQNNIYQVQATFATYQPFYFTMMFLPNGVLYEISDIANGLNADALGVNLQFAPHIGFYECLNSSTVHITDFGYIYKSDEVAVLTSNGHFAFHDYFFYFANNDNKNCVGQLRYKFYLTGTNPFDPTNIPNYFGPTAGIVCQLVGAGHYTWPTEK
ncbi:unnamed protein product [Adineta steineri]|uniref:Uncharacterized protein n=2 Tax=Adineta steineri TaxID=433720 RepID=A0A819DBW0_9BILA|nr:unnamed protein product [Adineta steineri]CAF0896167.1 unnamed protein product [Adineta steineri]CAF3826521.1 unnamed protein product [Adineta steineri]